jgi:hypothetical protein
MAFTVKCPNPECPEVGVEKSCPDNSLLPLFSPNEEGNGEIRANCGACGTQLDATMLVMLGE